MKIDPRFTIKTSLKFRMLYRSLFDNQSLTFDVMIRISQFDRSRRVDDYCHFHQLPLDLTKFCVFSFMMILISCFKTEYCINYMIRPIRNCDSVCWVLALLLWHWLGIKRERRTRTLRTGALSEADMIALIDWSMRSYYIAYCPADEGLISRREVPTSGSLICGDFLSSAFPPQL